MSLNKTYIIIFFSLLFTACQSCIEVREEDKLLHAGPATDNVAGGIYFGLYKDNKYQFCDGTFMDPGCYTGLYSLSGDTIVLGGLKKHSGIPTNRFIIRRYNEMDSTYWQWKYPNDKSYWEAMRHNDSTMGSTGDIFPLDTKGEIVFDRNNYFLIRLDDLKNNR